MAKTSTTRLAQVKQNRQRPEKVNQEQAAGLSPEPLRRPGVAAQQDAIMGAAVTLFAAHGSRTVSVAAICRQASVSRDTFYRCYRDKAALVEALYQTAVNEHIVRVTDAVDLDYGNESWLQSAIDQTIDAILQNADIAQFLYQESTDPGSAAYNAVNAAYDRVATRMQRWSKQAQGDSAPREFYKALLFATQWLVSDAIASGGGGAAVRKAKAAAMELFRRAFMDLA